MLAFVLASALVQAIAAVPAPSPSVTPATLPWAVQFDLPSRITGRTYRIYVAKPFTAPPKSGWPVVYVLDADTTFPSLAAQMVLRTVSGDTGALIVGVAYPNAIETSKLRGRDLTPSQPTAQSLKTSGLPAPLPEDFGGAEDFHRFMMEELRPRIGADYPTDAADQSLLGYSFGGLFALGVLFSHPEAYRTYVAGSPSIWWNNREVLSGEAQFAQAVRSGRIAPRILITSGAWEQDVHGPNIPASGPKRDEALKQLSSAKMVDNAQALAARLANVQGAPGYKVRYVLFPEETHLTGIPASASRGLAFIFSP